MPGSIAPDKKQAYGPAKMAMLVDLQKQVAGPLVCGSNGAVYPGMAGSQIQNWGKSKKYSKREIPMLQKAVAAGALFEAHGSAVCHADGDPHDPAIQTELGSGAVLVLHVFQLVGDAASLVPCVRYEDRSATGQRDSGSRQGVAEAIPSREREL